MVGEGSAQATHCSALSWRHGVGVGSTARQLERLTESYACYRWGTCFAICLTRCVGTSCHCL